MCWKDSDCLHFASTMEGAIWWGVFSALDQWCISHRPGRPQTRRPTDADLVEAVRDGGLKAHLLEKFANEYQVFRYPLNLKNQREERLNAVGIAVHQTYCCHGVPKPADLARMWWTAIGEVRNAMARFGPTANLKSFCMKSLWLYHPARATMWDSFAVRALNAQLNKQHDDKIVCVNDAAAFLRNFENLFEAQNALINEVIEKSQSVIGQRYAYPRRVLDKALWLLGEEDEEKKNGAWRMILGTNAKVRAATEQRFPRLAA